MIVEQERIDKLVAEELERFTATRLTLVMVKTAPWLEGEPGFGYVLPAEYRSGETFLVYRRGGMDEAFATLEDMLKRWIGD
jgi:hypothetical protein